MLRHLAKLLVILVLGAVFLAADFPARPLNPFEPVVEAQERKKKRGFFQRLFGGFSLKRKQERRAPPVIREAAPAAAPVITTLPKIPEANRILILGDLTASVIAAGLTDAYKRTPSVAISPRISPDVAIAGDDFYNWLDASDFTFVGERVKAVVVALGTNDRTNMLTPSGRIAFGTDEWRRAYVRRLVDVAAQLQLLRIPVIWVLPVPVLDNRGTQQAITIGEFQRSTVEPFNFRIVDVVGGFTNDEGEYRQSGASLEGSRVLLRLNDGIGFTKAGQKKLAYYVRREIDQILDDDLNNNFVLEGGARTNKPISQQVVILTRPALRRGEALAGSNGRSSAFYRDPVARNFFVKGELPETPIDRVDNFVWEPIPEGEAALQISPNFEGDTAAIAN